MLTDYILQKLAQARYKILEDGTYFGKIPGLQGVWASEKTLEKCREMLREVLEEWLILKLRDGDKIPDFPTIKPREKVYA
jgi:predicted RNase H-like HicB family nuclease